MGATCVLSYWVFVVPRVVVRRMHVGPQKLKRLGAVCSAGGPPGLSPLRTRSECTPTNGALANAKPWRCERYVSSHSRLKPERISYAAEVSHRSAWAYGTVCGTSLQNRIIQDTASG